ncbi:hypothetical protein EJ06DRAFT_51492 [Trichodelitschia bisporula]|uniref:Uncharacterized protein n=1 Tax=Trichodelitschia bisporula TaxID=703511 RepID=A0A6G1HU79_9PEZI|nr:hypothetical protein EJ06DRAFT_51492 [Trichodelitschia bisporula]
MDEQCTRMRAAPSLISLFRSHSSFIHSLCTRCHFTCLDHAPLTSASRLRSESFDLDFPSRPTSNRLNVLEGVSTLFAKLSDLFPLLTSQRRRIIYSRPQPKFTHCETILRNTPSPHAPPHPHPPPLTLACDFTFNTTHQAPGAPASSTGKSPRQAHNIGVKTPIARRRNRHPAPHKAASQARTPIRATRLTAVSSARQLTDTLHDISIMAASAV